MHECPACGYACDCDGEDTWNDVAAKHCTCPCDLDDDNDFGDMGCPLCGAEDCDCVIVEEEPEESA